jgi:hypothetical protein
MSHQGTGSKASFASFDFLDPLSEAIPLSLYSEGLRKTPRSFHSMASKALHPPYLDGLQRLLYFRLAFRFGFDLFK